LLIFIQIKRKNFSSIVKYTVNSKRKGIKGSDKRSLSTTKDATEKTESIETLFIFAL